MHAWVYPLGQLSQDIICKDFYEYINLYHISTVCRFILALMEWINSYNVIMGACSKLVRTTMIKSRYVYSNRWNSIPMLHWNKRPNWLIQLMQCSYWLSHVRFMHANPAYLCYYNSVLRTSISTCMRTLSGKGVGFFLRVRSDLVCRFQLRRAYYRLQHHKRIRSLNSNAILRNLT